MGFISDIIAIPLGWIMNLGYVLTSSYGLAILFFAVITKTICFPFTLMAQKSSIRLINIQPELEHIKRTHYGDRERINEEQYQLYKKEKYSPMSGLIPLLAQLFLLFGMVAVIRNPERHIQTANFNSIFVGFDLNNMPFNGGVTPFVILALLSGTSSYILCYIQNILNPAQRRMNFWGKWGMSFVIIGFSLYFPLLMQGGIGLYWVYSNLLSIIAALIANEVYNPKKLVPSELLVPPPKISREERLQQKTEKKRLTEIENESIKRFYEHPDKKKVMFYSISGGQYKYFSEIIDWLVDNTDITIHYVTNDPADKLLEHTDSQVEAYYIGEKKAITFMLKLHTVKMVIMTAPNLQQYHIKRSVADLDIEYVFTYHHFASLIVLRECALDNFDTVFCVGQHQIEEIRKTEAVYGLSPKKLVKSGYGQIDKLLRMYNELPQKDNSEPKILVAPSWSGGNLLDSCLDEIVAELANKYLVIIRPHPEYIKRFPDKWQTITNRFKNEKCIFDDNFLSNDSIYQSDILITDWSNIAYEFSYCTKKPAIYINTPMKVMNSEYHKLGIEPLDVTLRNKLGVSLDLDKLCDLPDVVGDMLNNGDKYRVAIESAVDEYLFYPGRSGEACGRYIASRVEV